MKHAARGQVVVISGPSGVGKGTVVRRLLENCPLPLKVAVSATTRPPRPGERAGVDYHFLAPEDFHARRRAGEMLECVEVFGGGHWYGTLRSEVTTSLERGEWVILEIDVEGARRVVRRFPGAITVFVAPPSAEELERRLRGRATEGDDVVCRRLEVARAEIQQSHWYRHRVVNDSVDRAAQEICDILIHSKKE